jgi:hypothetical protein
MASNDKKSKSALKSVIRDYDARTGHQPKPIQNYRKPKATTGQSGKANSDVFVQGRCVIGSGWAGRRQK